MARRCPSCGYSPIGPFTDNCPMCAEPVRNVRSDGGRYGGGMPMWAKWVLGAVVVGVLGVAGCCGLGLWRMGAFMEDAQKAMLEEQARAEAERKARTVAVSAADMLREFQKDPDAADEKYAGKYLELTGVVERTGRRRGEGSFVLLHGGDKDAKIKIECFFYYLEPEDEGRFRRLKAGQQVTVRGEYDGQVDNIRLMDCELAQEPPPAAGNGEPK